MGIPETGLLSSSDFCGGVSGLTGGVGLGSAGLFTLETTSGFFMGWDFLENSAAILAKDCISSLPLIFVGFPLAA